MSTDCLFCKIIAGDIPCTKVYEDDDVLVFMDIGPIIKGHALVIPKSHTETIHDTPAEVLGKLILTAQRVAGAQMNGLQADGVNIIQNNGEASGQLVPHLHVHVIPRFADDGHRWNWAAKEYTDPAEMQAYAEKISAKML